MKMNLPALLMVFIGVLLIYSAYKNEDPRNVVFEALGIKQRIPPPPGKVVGKWMEPSTTVPPANKPGVPVVTV